MNKHFYGWKPQLPDFRDYKYQLREPKKQLPPSADLRPQCPPVVDQGQLGSCTANSIANGDFFTQMAEKYADAFAPSRLFIYYNERAMEGTIGTDSGAEIRDGIKSIANDGVCPETEWPYDITQFTVKPSQQCYDDAKCHKAIQYLAVNQTLDDLRGCLAEGFPVVFGFTVYESFESEEVAKTGIVPMPKDTESVLGGHAVLCVGYDDSKKTFIVQNSWGTDWGDKGFFYMPYDYLTNPDLASDMWTIRSVSDDKPMPPAPTPDIFAKLKELIAEIEALFKGMK